jgi:signal transduction histidine kinase
MPLRAELWAGPSALGRRTYLLLGRRPVEDEQADPLRRLGEAVACVSHQIKNSLHALQGFARDIDRELGARPDIRRPASEMIRAVESLGDLANDLLAMSGAPRAARERIPVRAWIASAAALAGSPGARIRLALPADECHVRGHRGQLVHALFNLLDNACRVTPREEVVDVRVVLIERPSTEESAVTIEVIDAGPGLPAGAELANGRARSADGSGYGLLAARRFLEENGAKLSFERRAVGTCCRIELPVDAGVEPERAVALER